MLIQQILLEVFIGSLYLENPKQYGPISHFVVMDTYIFQSYWWRHMQCIYCSFLSAIYIHTHRYSNNKTYKSFQVIISGPRKPIYHFGLLRFSAINLSCLTWISAVISLEKLTGNILAQVSLKCTLSMLKISGKAFLEKFRCPYWKRDVYSCQI